MIRWTVVESSHGGGGDGFARIMAEDDTFDGMTPPTDKDVTYDGKPVADLLSSRPRTAWIWAVANLEDAATRSARAAIEEFIDGTGARLLLVPIGRGRIAVKP